MSTHIRLRARREGSHIAVRVFVGDNAYATHAKAGDLKFRAREFLDWRYDRATLEFLMEDGSDE